MAAIVALALLAPVRATADVGWVWLVIVALYLISLAIGGLRRRPVGSTTSQPKLTLSERFAEARQEAAAAQQTASQKLQAGSNVLAGADHAPAGVATTPAAPDADAPWSSTTWSGAAPPVRQVLVDALAQVLRTQAGAAVMPAMPAATPLLPGRDSGSALPTLTADAAQGLPRAHGAFDLASLTARLGTPEGLAFAIIAASVIGQPPALRSEPQEPGGW